MSGTLPLQRHGLWMDTRFQDWILPERPQPAAASGEPSEEGFDLSVTRSDSVQPVGWNSSSKQSWPPKMLVFLKRAVLSSIPGLCSSSVGCLVDQQPFWGGFFSLPSVLSFADASTICKSFTVQLTPSDSCQKHRRTFLHPGKLYFQPTWQFWPDQMRHLPPFSPSSP